MNLKDKINRKTFAAYGKNSTKNYGFDFQNSKYIFSNSKFYKKNRRRNFLITLFSIIGSIAIIIGFIYIPQLFIKESMPNDYIGIPDKGSIGAKLNYIDDCGALDFDNDGLTNAYETSIGSDIYRTDTDKDGVDDNLDSNPTIEDSAILDNLNVEGIFVGSAYEMNGVIMWANDNNSLAKGGAILLPNGNYRITNFKGWVSFPEYKYAYMLKNGIHTELKYKEKEHAWYIDQDCEVALTNEKPKCVNKFTFFNNVSYIDNNILGDVLSFVLPDKGFITSEKIWLEDTFVKVDKSKYAENVSYSASMNIDRFSHNDINLDNITAVYNTINGGNSVFVSLFNNKNGESILSVIGYTEEGHLIASDLEGKANSIIYIYPCASKTIDEKNHVSIGSWYEFKGCGYDSLNGDTISYFLSTQTNTSQSKTNGKTETSANDDKENPTIPPDTAPTEPTMPENGTMNIGGQTNYYIDGVIVTDSFIRNNNGKYEVCSSSDSGAFYVDSKGIKLTGKITINESNYYYNDGFYTDCFVVCGDSYHVGSQYTSNTIYVNSYGQQIYGWFDAGAGNIYASQNGYIAHNCFVTNSNGQYRYVGEDGTIITNKLITIDGIEIIIDETGNIVNENYAINVINSNFVS